MLKVYIESEWKVYKHERVKDRTWRKLRFATDVKNRQTGASEMTSNSRGDTCVVPKLLTHIDGKAVSLSATALAMNAIFTV